MIKFKKQQRKLSFIVIRSKLKTITIRFVRDYKPYLGLAPLYPVLFLLALEMEVLFKKDERYPLHWD